MELIDAPQTWAELWALGPGRYVWVQTAPLPWEPVDTLTGSIQAELVIRSRQDRKSALTATLRYTNGIMSLCAYLGEQVSGTADGRWSGRIATATPPQEMDLPMAKGYMPCGLGWNNVYSKNQFGIVTINFCFKRTDNAPLTVGAFATLPVGYRPSRHVFAVAMSDEGAYAPLEICVRSEGNVDIVVLANAGSTDACGTISFVAAQ